MSELDDLTTQLAGLKRARASGALVVRHGDTSVTYRSMSELLAAINAVQDDINKLNGTGKRKPGYVFQPDKGYES